MSRSEHLLLPRQFLQAIIEQAKTEYPNECCGLLAGTRDGDTLRVQAWHALVNEAPHPRVQYLSSGESMFKAERAMRAAGHDTLAVYHSHPTSEPIPSKTDLAWEYLADVHHLIIGLNGPEPVVRVWWLSKMAFQEAKWEIVEP